MELHCQEARVFKPDLPITSKKDDLLGRATFAESFGLALLQYSYTESIVAALYGEWGSGKSSIVNMTREFIEETARNDRSSTQPLLVEFNPWNYSDQNQLLTQFFKVLSTALNKQDYGEQAKAIGEKLEAYSDFFTPLAMLPDPTGMGVSAALASRFATKTVGAAAKKWGAAYSKDLQETRRELNNLLRKQDRKIIIIIDDIDRLTSVEIRQTFQLVKMLGDFPNTVYVLAFSKEVVVRALADVQKGPGDEYLEKIVQFPIEVPPIGRTELEKLLFAQLDEIVSEIPERDWDQVYWGNVYQEGLKHFFRNLRDVTRYINTLKFSFEMVRGEVNAIDFIAMTALQVFEPNIYAGIRNNQDLFSGLLNSGYRTEEREKQQAITRIDEVLNRAVVLTVEQTKDLLSRLFPKVESLYQNMGYGHDFMQGWRRSGRICHPEIFNTFFSLAIPQGDLSKSEMETLIGLARNEQDFDGAMQSMASTDRILRFLELLLDYIPEAVTTEQIPQIAKVLLNIADTLPQSPGGFFESDTSMKILRVMYQLTKRYDSQEARFDLLKTAIEFTEQSIWSPVRLVGILGQEHGKATSNDERLEPEEDRTITADQLVELERLAIQKIEHWAGLGNLIDHKELASILFAWRRLAPDQIERIQAVAKGLVADNNGMIKFICAFVNEGTSQSLSDSVATRRWTIEPQSIAEFVNIDSITPRLRELLDSSEFTELNEEAQRAVRLYLDTLDGKVERR